MLAAYQNNGKREWEEAEVSLLAQIGDQLGVALQQAEYLQKLQAQSQELEQAAQQKQLLNKVIERIRESSDLDALFRSTAKEVRRLLNAERVGVFRFCDRNYDEGIFVAEDVLPGYISVVKNQVKDHCFGKQYAPSYREGRIQAVADIHNANLSDCHIEILANFQIRANLIVPLIQGNELWGLLCIHQCSAPRQWQDLEISLVKQIADQFGVALQQAEYLEQLPLTAELSSNTIDRDEILQRAGSVFAQLQEKLGDDFSDETYLPTSEELGFDIVLSIFETGVNQRLESIAEVLENPPNNIELADFLRSQVEVFLGLAESLNLPGFGAIAQTTITALEANPTLALKIGEIALADLRLSREAVFAGDRTSGGKPSTALEKLTTVATDDIADVTDNLSIIPTDNSSVTSCSFTVATSLRSEVEELYKFLTSSNTPQKSLKPAAANFYLRVIRYILGWFNHEIDIPYQELSLALLIPKNEAEPHVNHLENWLFKFIDFLHDEEDSHSLYLYRQGVILNICLAVAQFQYQSNDNDK